MKRIALLALVLAPAALAPAQMTQPEIQTQAVSPIEIKGHHIGETIQEFMAAQRIPNRLRDCSALLSERKKPNDKKIRAINQSEHGLRFDSDECLKIADGLTGHVVEFQPWFSDYAWAHMTFADNKLVQISLLFPETRRPGSFAGMNGPLLSFGEVLHDLTIKFGPPDTTGERQMQNGFGAVFTFPVANWSKTDVTICATQDRNENYTNLTSVIILERAYADRLAQKEKELHSALQ